MKGQKMKSRIFLVLSFLLAAGCEQYAQQPVPVQTVQNVYVKPGQVFTAEFGKRYILTFGKPLDWSNVYPPPEVVYFVYDDMKQERQREVRLIPGRKYVPVWKDDLLNKEPVYLYPGQSFEFNDDNVYFLAPGPLIDSSKEEPKPEVYIIEPNVRRNFVKGKRYALLPKPEDSWYFIHTQAPTQLTRQSPGPEP